MEIVTQLVTPFYLGEVDYDVLEFSADRQVRYGADGILVCGRWGEKSTLKDSEHIKAAKSAVKAVKGRIKVYASAASNDSAKSERMTEELLSVGVDGVTLCLPYYNKGKEKEVVNAALKIREKAKNKRVFMFYEEDRSLKEEWDKELSEGGVETVRADGAWSKSHYDGDRFLLNALCVDSIVFSVISNVFPSAFIHIREKWAAGERAEAVKGYFEIKDKIDLLATLSVPALKYALSLWGLSYPTVRSPLIEPNDEEKALIRGLFD